MPTEAKRRARLAKVDAAFESLPERFLGASERFRCTYHIRIGDTGRTWEVRVLGGRCEVHRGATHDADVVIGTDASTWLELREGKLSGIDAFSQRRLYVRGRLDEAIAFEGLFHLPNGRPPLMRVRDVPVGKEHISTLTLGSGAPVLLLHGLGATKASFFETAAALTGRYRVHVVDQIGFGSSSKPRAAYDAAFMARNVVGLMDALEIEQAHLVGNSLGGRVAIEVALREPERVRALALLAPAMAFIRRRQLVPLAKLIRPELSLLPHRIPLPIVNDGFWNIFARPARLDPAVADIAVQEFQRNYGSPRARLAFASAARSVYLDEPFGEDGFWSRLTQLEPPALFVWGKEDRLVPVAFARRVREALPDARMEILDDCGHAPQVELPERTNELVKSFLAEADGGVVTRRLAAMRNGLSRRSSRNGSPAPAAAAESA